MKHTALTVLKLKLERTINKISAFQLYTCTVRTRNQIKRVIQNKIKQKRHIHSTVLTDLKYRPGRFPPPSTPLLQT